jgi:hypothetical protein
MRTAEAAGEGDREARESCLNISTARNLSEKWSKPQTTPTTRIHHTNHTHLEESDLEFHFLEQEEEKNESVLHKK